MLTIESDDFSLHHAARFIRGRGAVEDFHAGERDRGRVRGHGIAGGATFHFDAAAVHRQRCSFVQRDTVGAAACFIFDGHVVERHGRSLDGRGVRDRGGFFAARLELEIGERHRAREDGDQGRVFLAFYDHARRFAVDRQAAVFRVQECQRFVVEAGFDFDPVGPGHRFGLFDRAVDGFARFARRRARVRVFTSAFDVERLGRHGAGAQREDAEGDDRRAHDFPEQPHHRPPRWRTRDLGRAVRVLRRR